VLLCVPIKYLNFTRKSLETVFKISIIILVFVGKWLSLDTLLFSLWLFISEKENYIFFIEKRCSYYSLSCNNLLLLLLLLLLLEKSLCLGKSLLSEESLWQEKSLLVVGNNLWARRRKVQWFLTVHVLLSHLSTRTLSSQWRSTSEKLTPNKNGTKFCKFFFFNIRFKK